MQTPHIESVNTMAEVPTSAYFCFKNTVQYLGSVLVGLLLLGFLLNTKAYTL